MRILVFLYRTDTNIELFIGSYCNYVLTLNVSFILIRLLLTTKTNTYTNTSTMAELPLKLKPK